MKSLACKTILPFLFLALCTAQSLGQTGSVKQAKVQVVKLAQLKAAAKITRDTDGIPHLFATNAHDLYFLNGYVHAEDRLLQMDLRRREASGTLAELLGPSALQSDVELRTLGIRRAAEQAISVLSNATRAALDAYAEGVNTFIAGHPLPPEYALLELTQIPPWTALDSVAIGKLRAFGPSIGDLERTVVLGNYVQALGDDKGTALFFEDLFRSAPFDSAATIPDAQQPTAAAVTGERVRNAEITSAGARFEVDDHVLVLGKKYLDRVHDVPLFKRIRERDRLGGSNQWVVSGQYSTSGFPLLANDPHLSLDSPSVFYPIQLAAPGSDVIGNSFAGSPFVIVGHTREISWGATDHPMDDTDIYQEQLLPDPSSPSGLSTVYKGKPEHVIPIPEVFRQNSPQDGISDNISVVSPGGPIPPYTLIVPRRNNGPLISLDVANGVGLSMQYTGFGPTRELDTFRLWNQAHNLGDFIKGLQYFDFGSQSWAYSDILGNIAYFTSGELPIREDLQLVGASFVEPNRSPAFVRAGTGGNEWLAVQNPQPDQTLPFEILPFQEMPHLINPPAGWFVNANNDPLGITLDNDPLNQCRSGTTVPKPCQAGEPVYYLAPGYNAGFRAGRITQLLKQKLAQGKVSFADMQAMQADTVMPDAQVFVPYILRAFQNAQLPGTNLALAALGNNPSIAEAVGRLVNWDFSTPTGIREGYDAGDDLVGGELPEPSEAEVRSSVAATIYNVWRGRFIANTIDAVVIDPLPKPDNDRTLIALRHLLDNFDGSHGVGASGVDFFPVPPGADPTVQRDFAILKSLSDALLDLAGNAYAPAFGGSSDQDDYRWGLLHRIVFEHPLDGAFNIPPALGHFPHPLGAGLPGIPTDGGFQTIDSAGFSERAAGVNGFMFSGGAVFRFVTEAQNQGIRAESSLPGGVSGVPGNPRYFDLLPAWLVNDSFPLRIIIAGDLNGDGLVNCDDLKIIKASFGKKSGQAGFDPRADVNNDGVVNVRDLSFVSLQLPAGTKCS